MKTLQKNKHIFFMLIFLGAQTALGDQKNELAIDPELTAIEKGQASTPNNLDLKPDADALVDSNLLPEANPKAEKTDALDSVEEDFEILLEDEEEFEDQDEQVVNQEEEPEDEAPAENAAFQGALDTKIEPKGTSLSKSKTPCTRTIKVTNSIDDSMLGYKHWSGTYTPKTFVIHANGKKINEDKTKSIEITNNRLLIRYDYDFGYNIKKARGAVEITFEVDDTSTTCDLTFSWDNKWRILIDNATALSEEQCEFDA